MYAAVFKCNSAFPEASKSLIVSKIKCLSNFTYAKVKLAYSNNDPTHLIYGSEVGIY